MQEWQALCDRHGILLIEDCAQSHLAALGGSVAGSFGAAGAYSFYPTKNLGAPGDAGMLVTPRADVAERAKQLRNYGQSERYHHPVVGMNSRLDEVHAAMLAERLKWLPAFTERRREIAGMYRKGIRSSRIRQLAEPQEPGAHVYHLYVVLCEQRAALMEHLKAQGVQSLIHYPVPVHHQEPCRSIRRDPRGLESSEAHAATCLSLPCHPQMSDAAVQAVVDAVNGFRGA
jgi:dTDP-4-amino-4,6-dideoxygalactose transaminase